MVALTLIAHQAGVSSIVTVWATGLFLLLRALLAIGMISGALRFPARPIAFTAGWLFVIAVGFEILRLG